MAKTILFPIVLTQDAVGTVLMEDINHHCYGVLNNDGTILTDAEYKCLKSDPDLGFFDVASHYKIALVGS